MGIVCRVEQARTLEQVLHQADIITLHVPLTANTKQMMNANLLQHVKRGAILLNFARGGIVHEQDMLDALEEQKIAAYVTDFPTASLKNHPRVISLPHLGASTQEAEENCAINCKTIT